MARRPRPEPDPDDDAAIPDNEAVCDARIKPLALQIHDICEAHGMPLLLSVEYQPHGLCTTAYVPAAASPQLKLAAEVARGNPRVMRALGFRRRPRRPEGE